MLKLEDLLDASICLLFTKTEVFELLTHFVMVVVPVQGAPMVVLIFILYQQNLPVVREVLLPEVLDL